MTEKLDSGIEMQKQQLSKMQQGFSGEVIGYGTMYSVGADWNCIVSRDWLLRQADELDIPESILPSEVSSIRAFGRAMKRIREDWDNEFEVAGHDVEIEFKDGDKTRLTHVYARTFFESEECGEEGGKWSQSKLGHIDYSKDDGRIILKSADIEGKAALQRLWGQVTGTVRRYKKELEVSHHAQDIRGMMQTIIKKRSDTIIPLRRAVYMVPVGLGDLVDSMAKLFKRINNEFKRKGENVAIRTFEILDTEEKREWIQQKVEEEVTSNVDSIIDKALEEFDADKTATEVVEMIEDNVVVNENTAQRYNQLLEAEITVTNLLKDKKNEIREEKKENIIGRVIDRFNV